MKRYDLFRMVFQTCLLCAVLSTTSAAREANAITTLIAPEEPMPVIVLPSNATACWTYAAQELADHLELMTTRRPAIVTDDTDINAPYIAVGPGKLTESLGARALDIEEFVIDIQNDKVLIAGGYREPVVRPDGSVANPRDRGTLYGVYEFLESLGVRWYRPESWGRIVPKTDTITLPVGRAVYRPAFEIRFSMNDYRWYKAKPTAQQQELGKQFFTRMRLNTNMWTEPKYGGYITLNFAHAYMYLIPPKNYFKDHPEYFALIDGERSDSPAAQLCLSNPEVLDIVSDKIIASGLKGLTWGASIEANDGGMWCQCDKCRVMDDPNLKTPYGVVSKSNRVFAFANAVAERVRTKVPDFKVCLLAYNQHNEIPTLVNKLQPNIAVQVAAYASAASDYSRLLRDPTSAPNAYFLKQLEGWTKMAEHVTTYEYWSGYTWSGPLPVIHTMVDRLCEYRRLGIKGCYNQAGDNISWGPQGLNMVMFCKLMWNPNLDVRKELDYYFDSYFGPAAEPMKAYVQMQEDAAAGGPWFGSGGSFALDIYCNDLIERMGACIAQAQQAVAGNELLEKRLYGIWAGYEYVRLLRQLENQKLAGQFDDARVTAEQLETFFFAQKDGWVWENHNDPPNEPTGFILKTVKEARQAAEDMKRFVNPEVLAELNDDWLFKKDPDNQGRNAPGWFSAETDTTTWGKIRADNWWENQGHPGYDGHAWYRRTIQCPDLNGKTPVLFFGAVDGDADIWINGKYLGHHAGDVGAPNGWEEPFWFDASELLTPGNNQITVLVNATIGMGGIWKGVLLAAVDGVRQ